MPVMIDLDRVLRDRKMTGKELARRVGLSQTQMSLLRSGKVRGFRLDTLARICASLACSPGDILRYEFSPDDFSADDGDD
ncbi:helix-turn-helix transcriptional regulator [Citromicrobium bathyomarinum]|nr:Cro/Cl family transcriptional regulator [Citromicrobium sp.]MCD1623178.1 helix-turn-helix transcriptional regulator [Citromicrobium bathyomarinum]